MNSKKTNSKEARIKELKEKITNCSIKKLQDKINNLLDELREFDINYSCSFLFPSETEKAHNHIMFVGVDVKDNHHFLDCISSQLKMWEECNHIMENGK